MHLQKSKSLGFIQRKRSITVYEDNDNNNCDGGDSSSAKEGVFKLMIPPGELKKNITLSRLMSIPEKVKKTRSNKYSRSLKEHDNPVSVEKDQEKDDADIDISNHVEHEQYDERDETNSKHNHQNEENAPEWKRKIQSINSDEGKSALPKIKQCKYSYAPYIWKSTSDEVTPLSETIQTDEDSYEYIVIPECEEKDHANNDCVTNNNSDKANDSNNDSDDGVSSKKTTSSSSSLYVVCAQPEDDIISCDHDEEIEVQTTSGKENDDYRTEEETISSLGLNSLHCSKQKSASATTAKRETSGNSSSSCTGGIEQRSETDADNKIEQKEGCSKDESREGLPSTKDGSTSHHSLQIEKANLIVEDNDDVEDEELDIYIEIDYEDVETAITGDDDFSSFRKEITPGPGRSTTKYMKHLLCGTAANGCSCGSIEVCSRPGGSTAKKMKKLLCGTNDGDGCGSITGVDTHATPGKKRREFLDELFGKNKDDDSVTRKINILKKAIKEKDDADRVKTAGFIGGVTGLLVGGPIIGVLGGILSAYIAKKNLTVNDVAGATDYAVTSTQETVNEVGQSCQDKTDDCLNSFFNRIDACFCGYCICCCK